MMRNLPKHLLGACLFLSMAMMGRAASIDIQLGAGSLGIGTAPFDDVTTAGQNFVLNLTKGVPLTQTFYTANYFAGCGTCSGTMSGTLSDALIVTDMGVAATGTGQFAQQFSTTISGGATTGNHTFQALLSQAITVTLNNGETVTITPLASTPPVTTSYFGSGSQSVSATFLLGPVAAAPEPSSILLSSTAFGGTLLLLRRRKRV